MTLCFVIFREVFGHCPLLYRNILFNGSFLKYWCAMEFAFEDQLLSQDSQGSQVTSPVATPPTQGPDIGLFIETMQNFPYLYDISDKRYKDQKLKSRACGEVAEIVGSSAEDCQKIWKSLRDKFLKENKKLTSGAEASGNTWEYFNSMYFYSKFAKPRRTFTNVLQTEKSPPCTPTTSRPSSSNSDWSTMDQILFSDEDAAMPSQVGQKGKQPEVAGATPKTKKRKQDTEVGEILNVAREICQQMTVKPTMGENETFCSYVLTRLNRIPEEVAAAKRKQILNIIEDQ